MNNPFEHTQSVAFELSNFCNLSALHPLCPLHAERASPFAAGSVATLPMRVVAEALVSLARYAYAGAIEFHQYNEPLIDPRLFSFVGMAHALLPMCAVEIVTNGTNLTAQLAKELHDYGVRRLHVSLYGTAEEKESKARWLEKEIAPHIATTIGRHGFDDRLNAYARVYNDSRRPCFAPLAFLTINCRAQVGLCCFDWGNTVVFGSVAEQHLEDVVMSRIVQEAYRHLSSGERVYDICKRCLTSRGAYVQG